MDVQQLLWTSKEIVWTFKKFVDIQNISVSFLLCDCKLSIIIHNRAGEQELPMDLCRPLLRELREVPQPASAEYLSTMREGGTSRYTTHLSPTQHEPLPTTMGRIPWGAGNMQHAIIDVIHTTYIYMRHGKW